MIYLSYICITLPDINITVMNTENIKQQDEERVLKSQFCRQYFPELMQFLRDFDISEVKGKSQNSLNMHFLLQAYNYVERQNKETEDDNKKKIIKLKERCHWRLSNVDETDVLFAIDDYFAITSHRHDLKDLRNTLIKNLTTPGFHIRYKFEDSTTKFILSYFGINTEKDGLGFQRQNFTKFIIASSGQIIESPNDKDVEAYINDREELQFDNAFRLLRCLRNWDSHAIEGFSSDEVLRYYRFILYTHIGITYICRRLWKRYEDILLQAKGKTTYSKPSHIDITDLPIDTVKVVIKANQTDKKIGNCKYAIGQLEKIKDEDYITIGGAQKNNIEFDMPVSKYEPFEIVFTCDGNEYRVQNMLNYYLWNPVLNITVDPPVKFSYSLSGVAGGDDAIEKQVGQLVTKYIQNYQGAGTTVEKKVLDLLEKMEPMLFQLRDFSIKKLSSKEEIKKQEFKEKVINLLNSFDNKLMTLSDNNNSSERKVDSYFQNISEQIKIIDKSIADLQKGNYKKDRAIFVAKHIPIVILFVIALCTFIGSVKNDYSLVWLENKAWYIGAFIGIMLVSGLILWFTYETTIRTSLLTIKKKAVGISLLVLTFLLLIGAWAVLPNKNRKSLVANYSFEKEQKEGDNAKAAKIMEEYLEDEKPADDEMIRVKLADYYLNYTGQPQKAMDMTLPMLVDMTKYKDGVLAYAKALYERKEYTKVWRIIEDYKKVVNPNSPVVACLEGVMLAWGQGCTKNVHKGFEKLIEAQNNGYHEAQYHIGRFVVNDMTDWNTNNINMSDMDLIRGARYLQSFALYRPQAALELGRLYADLNMADSASYYYDKAIRMSSDSLLLEAKYRMGLLLENQGDSTNHFLREVEIANYAPALLHHAINEKDHKTLIELYEEAGVYNGYRYLAPIAFEYIAIGEPENALKALQEARPNGLFDLDFVKGMELLLGTDQKEKNPDEGWQHILQSASNGCKFAQMMCLYQEAIKKFEENKEIPQPIYDTLANMGKEISFAYVLKAFLMKMEGHYDVAYVDAINATSHGHPAGVMVMPYSGGDDDYMKSVMMNRKKSFWYFQMLQIALRKSPIKANSIVNGFRVDSHIYNIFKKEDFPLYRVSFWCDIAMANKFKDMECLLLDLWMRNFNKMEGSNIELAKTYMKRLISSILRDSENEIKFPQKKLIIASLKKLPSSYKESLCKEYKYNHYISDILNTQDDYGYKPGEELPFSIGNLSLNKLSNDLILLELSDVIGLDYFHMPVKDVKFI